jgi:hypothetical protein
MVLLREFNTTVPFVVNVLAIADDWCSYVDLGNEKDGSWVWGLTWSEKLNAIYELEFSRSWQWCFLRTQTCKLGGIIAPKASASHRGVQRGRSLGSALGNEHRAQRHMPFPVTFPHRFRSSSCCR